MKVFLDTNVLASALATRGLCAELFEAVLQSHELLVSPPVMKELECVLPGKLGLSRQITEDYIALLRNHATLIIHEKSGVSLPDPDDEPIVASALFGKAQVFVTGDKALLQLGKVEGLPIISPRQFWEMLAGRE